MQRVICDQLVKCMETHNKNVFAKRVDLHNEMTMKACVEILLNHGHIPVMTVKNMNTMQESTYNVNKSKMLREDWSMQPYTKLAFVMKGNENVEEYSAISMPKCAV